MAENASNASVASRLIFLSQLHDVEATTKVRFLACVEDYDEETGHLLVQHDYHAFDASSRAKIQAWVDVNLVLEVTSRQCLQKGAWVNVIGYVQDLPMEVPTLAHGNGRQGQTPKIPNVQAVMIWDAGAVDLGRYEDTVKQHLSLSQKG